MVWFKVDDGFYTSKKVLSIPRTQRLSAVGLWTMAGNWSGRELSDGVVPAYVLDELGATPNLRDALVKARLWLDHPDGGVEFHDWVVYQPTREYIEEERRKTKERQQRHRDKTRDEPVSNASVTRDSHVSHTAPTRPDPTRPKEEAKASSPSGKKREIRIPEDWKPTAAHQERASAARVDLAKEAEAFKLHAETYDRHAASWNAAFTTWLNKAKPSAPTAPRAMTVAELVAHRERVMNGGG